VSQSSQHPTIVLAHGQVHMSDTIKVELVQPDGEPARIVVSWPNHVTVCSTAKYAEAAANAMRILANGVTELSRIKAGKRR
jgi:ABC-type proline/glycine betaine transport system substrate-binding protein